MLFLSGVSCIAVFTYARSGIPESRRFPAHTVLRPSPGFSHDIAVIGGGSGGLSVAKEAAKSGARVALFDHVIPSHKGTKWGFAGTCVNVGCIPKKIFHYASLLSESLQDLKLAGWSELLKNKSLDHKWSDMVSTATNTIKRLSFSYRVGARKAGVEYINSRAKFSNTGDENELHYTLNGQKKVLRAKHIVIAVGGRPFIPPIPGIEHAITSDDIFYSETAPGRTLIVGGGYIAMEVAGFLTSLGNPTTVAARSTVLNGFDTQMVNKLKAIMYELGTDFKLGTNIKSLTKRPDNIIEVMFEDGNSMEFDTVLVATGRTPATGALDIPKTVTLGSKGKLVTDENLLVKGTRSIYAVGDCVHGYPELASVAVKAGELLARRLFFNETKVLDLRFYPTTIFTPSEYGTVGLSEDDAVIQFGSDGVESYLYEWSSLERQTFHREKPLSRRKKKYDINLTEHNCMAKLIVVKKLDAQNGRVVGFHFIGPNAGEVTQGFALAIKLGATKADFDDLIGLHPTDAEAFSSLTVTKSSGNSFVAKRGCGGGKCG